MNKKGDFGWKQTSEILLVVGILIILLILMTLFKEKSLSLLNTLKNIVRFGT